jgi:hypothetical protein
MNVSHRGIVGMMHDKIIQEVGPHPRILHGGNKQVMYLSKLMMVPFGQHQHKDWRQSTTDNLVEQNQEPTHKNRATK